MECNSASWYTNEGNLLFVETPRRGVDETIHHYNLFPEHRMSCTSFPFMVHQMIARNGSNGKNIDCMHSNFTCRVEFEVYKTLCEDAREMWVRAHGKPTMKDVDVPDDQKGELIGQFQYLVDQIIQKFTHWMVPLDIRRNYKIMERFHRPSIEQSGAWPKIEPEYIIRPKEKKMAQQKLAPTKKKANARRKRKRNFFQSTQDGTIPMDSF